MNKKRSNTRISNFNTVSKIKWPTFLAICLLLAGSLHAQQTDYSGTWARNDAKCTLGEGVSLNSIPIEVDVVQDKAGIVITRKSRNGKGETSAYTEKLAFDSTLSPAVAVKPNVNKQSALKWSGDRKGLQETAKYIDDQGATIQKMKTSWTLADGGKSLLITVVLEAGGDTFDMTEYFDRK